MSAWNLGADHDSDEVAYLKQQVANKDNALGTIQSQMLKKKQQLDELTSTYNEALQKLQQEADQSQQHQEANRRISENLQNEQVQRQNAELSLKAVHDQLKARSQEVLELQSTIYSLSNNVESSMSTNSSLQRDNAKFRSRIQELEVELNQATQSANTRPAPRPSPVFQTPSAVAQRQISDLQETSKRQEENLSVAREELRRTRDQLVQVENEKLAQQKRYQQEVADMKTLVESKDDELNFLRGQSGGDAARAREDELLRRIEEEEARVEALNLMIRQSESVPRKVQKVEEALHECERKLSAERSRVLEMEDIHGELVREKEEALDELDAARHASQDLQSRLEMSLSEQRTLEAAKDTLASELKYLRSSISQSLRIESPTQADSTTVERLLCSAERLRAERNDAQRSVDFLNLELKCAQEELRKQRQLVLDQEVHMRELRAPNSTNVPTTFDALAARALPIVIQRLHTHNEHMQASLAHHSSLVDSLRVQFEEVQQTCSAKESQLETARAAHSTETQTFSAQREELEIEVHNLREEMADRQHAVEEVEQVLSDVKSQLDDVMESYDNVEQQRVSLNLQVYDLTSAYREVQHSLENVQTQLQDHVKALEDMEAQRDSYILQVRNLETDLEVSKEELEEAEQRYSLLQTKQLAAMSTTEVTRTLKSKIEQLEGRVDRRTEQIGIHQHDIKRLETNLRLQEERVQEMAVDLETMSIEKEAMVEDCAAAREARDDAMRKLEHLEMELESWEGKLETLERDARQVETDRYTEVATLVSIVSSTVMHRRKIARNAKASMQASAVELEKLSAALHLAEDKAATLPMIISNLEVERNEAVLSAQRANDKLAEVQQSIMQDVDARRELNGALNALYFQHANKARRLDSLIRMDARLQNQIAELSHELRSKTEALEQAHSDLQAKATERTAEESMHASLRAREAELLQQINALQADLASAQANQDAVILEKSTLTTSLDSTLANRDKLQQDVDRLQSEQAQAQSRYQEELEVLQRQLSVVQGELETTNLAKADLDALHRRAQDEWTFAKEELEMRIADLCVKADTSANFENDLAIARKQHAESLESIQERLKNAVQDARVAEDTRREMQATNDTLQAEHNALCQELEGLRMTTQSQPHEDIESATMRQELLQRATIAESALTQSRTDCVLMEQKLQQAIADRAAYEETQARMIVVQQQLQSAEASYRELLDESRERDRESSTLRKQLERVESELSSSEQALVSLQSQFEQQADEHASSTEALTRELMAASATGASNEAITELQEQCNQLTERCDFMNEEQMKADSLLISLRKEKKSLETKVASLTRKTQKLQSILDTVRAQPTAVPSQLGHVTGNQTPTNLPSKSASMAQTRQARPRTDNEAVTQQPVAGPSSGVRQTPPDIALARLARLRTPEASSSGTPAAGMKRRVPDDFEDSEGLPAQAFTAESLPSVPPTTTPRARTQVHASRSVFTPVRRQLPPAASPRQTSPVRRPAPSTATISDVTNSPRGRSAANAELIKRGGWLGKVRSGQAAGRGVKRQQVEDPAS